MSNQETMYLQIWKDSKGFVIGQKIDRTTFNVTMQKYSEQFRKWLLTGKTATCMVITDNIEINRSEAIQYCRSIVLGNYCIASFDLDRCEVTWKRVFGKPPATNRGVEN